ncbi:MAG TPA: MFS transporter [Chloroflexota bacterium]|nr:MFS transporter [Chloroflexota bacterium]
MQDSSNRPEGIGFLVGAIGGSFLVRLSGAATGVMLGIFMAQLHRSGAAQSSARYVGVLGAAFYLSELVGSPIAGFLIDRRGFRPLLLAGPTFGILAEVLFASPSHLALLTVARLLQGLTTACTIPAALAFLSDATLTHPGGRGRIMGFFEVASIGGLATGLVAGGFIWDSLGRPGFWILASIYAFAVAIFVVIKAGERERSARPLAESFLAIRHVSALAASWLALNAAAGLWFSQAAYQFSGAHPMLHQQLTNQMPVRQIGIIFGVYAVLFAIGTIAWGWALGRVSLGSGLRIGVFGCIFTAGAIVGVNHADQLGSWATVVFLILAVVGLAAQTAFTPAALTLLAARSDSVRHGRGAVMGVYSMLLAGGQLIGTILGAFVAETWGVDGLIGATIGLGIVAMVTVPRTISHSLGGEASEERPFHAATRITIDNQI